MKMRRALKWNDFTRSHCVVQPSSYRHFQVATHGMTVVCLLSTQTEVREPSKPVSRVGCEIAVSRVISYRITQSSGLLCDCSSWRMKRSMVCPTTRTRAFICKKIIKKNNSFNRMPPSSVVSSRLWRLFFFCFHGGSELGSFFSLFYWTAAQTVMTLSHHREAASLSG